MKYAAESFNAVLAALEETIPLYGFDQYMLYPFADKTDWRKYLARRLSDYLHSKEACCFYDVAGDHICMAGTRLSQWDEEHFGFKMAMMNWLVHPNTPETDLVLARTLDDCLSHLRANGVRFVAAHVSGDDLASLHMLEARGFRYYQTTVYSVAECANLSHTADPAVRLWQEADLPALVEIARGNQFSRGHYYCDRRFSRTAVDSMYEKWIRTSWKNQDPIAVLENDGRVAGYFAFVLDDGLSQASKYPYGRMTSLAMDASVRGKGLGEVLFRSVISLISARGGRYVASEYPLKNWGSAWLHAKYGFRPVHEKVLMHLWL